MYGNDRQIGNRWLSGAAAVAIVALGSLALEHGHDAALPEGVVELGQFEAGDPMLLANVMLPEIVVTAQAVEPSPTRLADRDRSPRVDGDVLAPIAASAAGVLLK